MHFVDLYNHLHDIHNALKTEKVSLEQQTECVNDLFLFLDTHQDHLFPAGLTNQAIQLFQWYLEYVLPELGYEAEDRQAITEDYQELLSSLYTSKALSQQLERKLSHIIGNLRNGTFRHEREVTETLVNVAQVLLKNDQLPSLLFLRTFRKKIRDGFSRKQILTFFERFVHAFQESFSDSPELLSALSNFQEFCEYILHAHFQGKAVLVDIARQGFIMPLWVFVESDKEGERVEFGKHDVDAAMQSSADAARIAACQYLRKICGKDIDDTISVRSQFPFPAVGYRDTSASLLIALQIVGEVLDLDHDPATVVTGEVDELGSILNVGWIQEKANITNTDETIKRVIVPAGNLHDFNIDNESRVTVVPVRSLAEALEQYYGESLRRQLNLLSRRQVLKSVAGLVGAFFILSGLKNLFAGPVNPVTECDWRLLTSARDLYQKESNYPHAVTILESILDHFHHDQSSSEAIRIQAFALGQLGVIHLQQHHVEASLRAFRKAVELWDAIHDRENQADTLFRLGEVYRYTVAMDGIRQNSQRGLHYYQQAHDLLSPSMKLCTRLQGKYYSLTGYMYYWIDEYETAEKLGRKALATFEEPDSNWTYQTARQHLARTLIKTGKYDEAHDILQSTAQAGTLQGPHDRARNALALSELYLAAGELEKGLQCAEETSKLCQEYQLQGQQRILTKSLAWHRLPYKTRS